MGNTVCALSETYLGVGLICGMVIGMLIGIVAAHHARSPFPSPRLAKPPVWRSGPGANDPRHKD